MPSSAPRNLSATAINSTAILVSWLEVAPADRNGNITSYDVMFVPLQNFSGALSTTPSVQGVLPSLSVLLTDLQEYVEYRIVVRASTSAGPGNYSNPVIERTQEDGNYSIHVL